MINGATRWIVEFKGGVLDGQTKEYGTTAPPRALKQPVATGHMDDIVVHEYRCSRLRCDPRANTATKTYELLHVAQIEGVDDCECLVCVARRSAAAHFKATMNR